MTGPTYERNILFCYLFQLVRSQFEPRFSVDETPSHLPPPLRRGPVRHLLLLPQQLQGAERGGEEFAGNEIKVRRVSPGLQPSMSNQSQRGIKCN